ncbi:chain length determinant protein tyrosine kinase EpsG [Aromatoleum bremense]|uniref:Chain length determinant protein tyrosine kinase EpsG n=1 Tax=Aromatoleum bremense TaxID=76115 RepID=A0ABX1NQ64_9RHOO|nr:chain length determinant protein tyrosine kinase EpsG [Aromatoleum bremense]NMG14114.1 chain length determinant protein tyrosine kinase EpsG [Aromatoleum bremense]QTQ33890.1 Chain length determinant protein tyrosine kinase [Aromatoleum bremense]
MDATPNIMDMRPAAEEQSIGAILVETGRLTAEDTQVVLREQKAKGVPFGVAAIELGLISQADVDFALARQFDYPYLPARSGIVAREVVAAYAPFGPVAESLRQLRSQVSLRWANSRYGARALALTGVNRGEGRSFVAANLAVVFAQMGLRTLLVDADLRHPTQHTLFHLDNRFGLSNMLAGRVGSEAIVRIGALRNLFVLPAGPTPPNPQELLARPLLAKRLRALEDLFDVVIQDTSAARVGADAQVVAAASGNTMLVVRKNMTPLKELREFQVSLEASGSRILGAVVNE